MSKPMNADEQDVAASLIDYLTGGDDQIPSKLGTITLHSLRGHGVFFASSEAMVARIDSKLSDEYEITIVARKRHR